MILTIRTSLEDGAAEMDGRPLGWLEGHLEGTPLWVIDTTKSKRTVDQKYTASLNNSWMHTYLGGSEGSLVGTSVKKQYVEDKKGQSCTWMPPKKRLYNVHTRRLF